mmetsp:Transcript_23299/g.64997  ORF Transcript_23299/g.64997 Transcript_23299/m.64997 type:complete len:106 (-) Transcript_23299:241-558(-)
MCPGASHYIEMMRNGSIHDHPNASVTLQSIALVLVQHCASTFDVNYQYEGKLHDTSNATGGPKDPWRLLSNGIGADATSVCLLALCLRDNTRAPLPESHRQRFTR